LISASVDAGRAAILNSIFLLGNHRDIQEKIFEQIKANEPLDSMIDLKCFILEQFRFMSTSLKGISRTAAKNSFLGKIKLYKGTQIEVIIAGPCMVAENFADPLAFDINRYTAENIKNLGVSNTLIPFSLGIRNCPGRFNAWSNIEIGLVNLLREF
jgi:cytochrome P450